MMVFFLEFFLMVFVLIMIVHFDFHLLNEVILMHSMFDVNENVFDVFSNQLLYMQHHNVQLRININIFIFLFKNKIFLLKSTLRPTLIIIIIVSRILNSHPIKTKIATVSAIINIIVNIAYNVITTFPDVNNRTTSAKTIENINDVYVPRITSRIKS